MLIKKNKIGQHAGSLELLYFLLGHVPYFLRLFILHCTKRDMAGWNQDQATTTHTTWETKN